MSWLRHLPGAPVTSLLVAINIVVYVTMAASGGQAFAFGVDTLVRWGANVVVGSDAFGAGASAAAPAISHWRWLTAAFMHVNLIHLAMNLTVLVQLGIVSERLVGGGLLAVGYVATGVAGNVLATVWAQHRGVPLLSAGASGAIMGLLGMVAVLAWVSSARPLAKMLLRNAAFIIVLGVGLSVSGRGFLDNGAHVGGLVAGAALGWVRSRIRAPMPRWLNRSLAVVAICAVIVGFVVVVRNPVAALTDSL